MKYPLEIYLRDEANDDGFVLNFLILPTTYAEVFSDHIAFYGEEGHDEVILDGDNWCFAGRTFGLATVYKRGTVDVDELAVARSMYELGERI
jgi:hypothetical protein